ncbi:translocation SEC62 [Sigmodon hispidus]
MTHEEAPGEWTARQALGTEQAEIHEFPSLTLKLSSIFKGNPARWGRKRHRCPRERPQPSAVTRRGGAREAVFRSQAGDSHVRSGLRVPRATRRHVPGPSLRPPPPRESTEAGRRRRASPSPEPPGGLHNGAASRRALARSPPPPPLLAPRQKEPGGAANMAERRRHKKRIQVARRSRGPGGTGALGGGGSGENVPTERAAEAGSLRGVAAPGPGGAVLAAARPRGLRSGGAGGGEEGRRRGARNPASGPAFLRRRAPACAGRPLVPFPEIQATGVGGGGGLARGTAAGSLCCQTAGQLPPGRPAGSSAG